MLNTGGHREVRIASSLVRVMVVVIAAAWCGTTRADVIAQYTFVTDLNPTTVGADIASASALGGLNDGSFAISRSSTTPSIALDGTTYPSMSPINNSTNTGGPTGVAFGRRFQSGSGDTFQHYYAFDLTVTTGYQLDLTSVVFDLGLRSQGPNAIKVEYSTTSDFSAGVVKIGEGAGYNVTAQNFLGYGTGGTLGVTPATISSDNYAGWNRYTNNTNLAGNESLTGTIYFRVWAKGTTGTNSSGQSNLYIDNITVNGTTAVIPEPAAAIVLSLGSVWLTRRRRVA